MRCESTVTCNVDMINVITKHQDDASCCSKRVQCATTTFDIAVTHVPLVRPPVGIWAGLGWLFAALKAREAQRAEG